MHQNKNSKNKIKTSKERPITAVDNSYGNMRRNEK